uniref:Putative mucin-like peritrophin n=1 Tax=Psorophora albipes TaxID=869069 RepID=T1E2L2_9DIPT
MKLPFAAFYSLLSIHFFFTGVFGKDPRCPENPSYTVHLPHPTDCGKFLTCVWGNTMPQNCPPGLHWNDRLKVCDWPGNANCSRHPHTNDGGTSTSTTTEASQSQPNKCSSSSSSSLCAILEKLGQSCSSVVLIDPNCW